MTTGWLKLDQDHQQANRKSRKDAARRTLSAPLRHLCGFALSFFFIPDKALNRSQHSLLSGAFCFIRILVYSLSALFPCYKP
jgi:hypothetical protein